MMLYSSERNWVSQRIDTSQNRIHTQGDAVYDAHEWRDSARLVQQAYSILYTLLIMFETTQEYQDEHKEQRQQQHSCSVVLPVSEQVPVHTAAM